MQDVPQGSRRGMVHQKERSGFSRTAPPYATKHGMKSIEMKCLADWTKLLIRGWSIMTTSPSALLSVPPDTCPMQWNIRELNIGALQVRLSIWDNGFRKSLYATNPTMIQSVLCEIFRFYSKIYEARRTFACKRVSAYLRRRHSWFSPFHLKMCAWCRFHSAAALSLLKPGMLVACDLSQELHLLQQKAPICRSSWHNSDSHS